jgi:NAD(P)H-hydrate epimerase
MAVTYTPSVPNENKLVSVAEMQAIERAADAGGHSYARMMEIAGQAVAETVLACRKTDEAAVLVLAGPGNNGGDGLVCARALHTAGMDVRVYLWKRSTDPEQDYEQHYAKLTALGVPNAHAHGDPGFQTLRTWLQEAHVVIDALLGTGTNRPIEGTLAELLNLVKQRQADMKSLQVIAVDCPSGLNCESGAVDPHTVSADDTVTFAYAKHGHYKFPGAQIIGELRVADIDTPPHLADDVQTFRLDMPLLKSRLPKRAQYSHKGSFGKVLAAVGSVQFPGAAYLSCAAAGRVGAGLVTGAVPRCVWQPVAGRLAEATWLPLSLSRNGGEEVIDGTALRAVLDTMTGYDSLIVGCGLGQAEPTRDFLDALLQYASLPPTVIDADGLNCLAGLDSWPDRLPAKSVLTPHPAEMARLCRMTVQGVVENRWELARRKAAEWHSVVLIKGPYTVVAEPEGMLAVLPIATPALATAGTGDVLAGAIGGLLAQAVDPFWAACLGAWLHGQAGLLCESEVGLAGTLATDLLPQLPRAMNELRTIEDAPQIRNFAG